MNMTSIMYLYRPEVYLTRSKKKKKKESASRNGILQPRVIPMHHPE